jgi:hypothetical protein
MLAGVGETVPGTACAKHPSGRPGKRFLAPFPLRLVVSLAGAALAVVLAASAERMVAAWAARLVRTGPPHVKRFAARKLTSLGDAGVQALFELARDRTVVPLGGSPPLSADLIPHDTVGDLALDALRRLRTGNPEAPRLFEWRADSGVSYEDAYEAYRAEELAEAQAWWRSVKGERAP